MSTRMTGLAVLVLLTGGCDPALTDIAVLGTLERDRIELAADTNEPIASILVREGQRVVADQPLIVQNSERAEAALAQSQAMEATARAALAEAEQGPRAQAIAQARARLEAAGSARQTARHELDRQASLVERNFASRNQVDILRGHFEEAVAREEEARAGLDELLEGTRNEKIDQARSQYAAALATVRGLEISLSRATLRSPVEGVIESLPFEVGERPLPGATVVSVLATSPVYARVHIPEPMRTRINSGTRAAVRIDSYDEAFEATVRWVSADAAFTPYYTLNTHDRTRLSFVAEIDLVSPPPNLPVGVPVQVTFPEL